MGGGGVLCCALSIGPGVRNLKDAASVPDTGALSRGLDYIA